MSRATYRCICGWSARRLAAASVECDNCGAKVRPADSSPGRPPAPPELARVEVRVRPTAAAVTVLGEDRAREVGRAAIERAAARERRR